MTAPELERGSISSGGLLAAASEQSSPRMYRSTSAVASCRTTRRSTATIDRDDRIDFWHDVVEAVHAESCKYILQLSMSGRQQDLPGVENLDPHAPPGSFYHRPLSSTDSRDSFHGLV